MVSSTRIVSAQDDIITFIAVYGIGSTNIIKGCSDSIKGCRNKVAHTRAILLGTNSFRRIIQTSVITEDDIIVGIAVNRVITQTAKDLIIASAPGNDVVSTYDFINRNNEAWIAHYTVGLIFRDKRNAVLARIIVRITWIKITIGIGL